ncbi:MAG: hypothetical protein HYW70_02640 [Candidatus Nealsonbacteria bacterium]|nr:hypothetical protein [Candidatus Nealsonbacteria bacterium]
MWNRKIVNVLKGFLPRKNIGGYIDAETAKTSSVMDADFLTNEFMNTGLNMVQAEEERGMAQSGLMVFLFRDKSSLAKEAYIAHFRGSPVFSLVRGEKGWGIFELKPLVVRPLEEIVSLGGLTWETAKNLAVIRQKMAGRGEAEPYPEAIDPLWENQISQVLMPFIQLNPVIKGIDVSYIT